MPRLTAEQVRNEEHKAFDSDHWDFHWQADGSCIITPLRWHDDASYTEYQGADCDVTEEVNLDAIPTPLELPSRIEDPNNPNDYLPF